MSSDSVNQDRVSEYDLDRQAVVNHAGDLTSPESIGDPEYSVDLFEDVEAAKSDFVWESGAKCIGQSRGCRANTAEQHAAGPNQLQSDNNSKRNRHASIEREFPDSGPEYFNECQKCGSVRIQPCKSSYH